MEKGHLFLLKANFFVIRYVIKSWILHFVEGFKKMIGYLQSCVWGWGPGGVGGWVCVCFGEGGDHCCSSRGSSVPHLSRPAHSIPKWNKHDVPNVEAIFKFGDAYLARTCTMMFLLCYLFLRAPK